MSNHPLLDKASSIIGGVLGLAGFILSSWWTVIAFTGGTMPLIGVEAEGGVGQGLFYLFFIEPIVVGILFWVGSIVAALILAPVALARRNRP